MGKPVTIETEMRERIMAAPEVILEDRDLMRALIAANERAMGANIVDLRGIAMERLEARLDRLEDTHRSVIAAAYENLAGTNQVHRAVLQLLEPTDFQGFLRSLGSEVAEILRVDCLRLVLESSQTGETGGAKMPEVVTVASPGFVAAYVGRGRTPADRQVTLRQVVPDSDAVYGEAAGWVRSEALIRLDLGAGRLPGLVAMGAEDPHQFKPTQGTDLLAFFGGVFERAMRRWLA
jgi:uncharacterized protein YigA (DUF484 family)